MLRSESKAANQPTMKPWKLVVSFAAIFLLGGAVGGFISMRIAHRMFFYPPSAEEMERDMIGHLKRSLDLSPEQVIKIQPIVGRATKEMSATQRDLTGRMTATLDKAESEIDDLLTAEQKRKFDAIEAKRREFTGGK